MPQYSAGNVIREVRRRKKISQEELAYGICSVSTLSKIESSLQNPNRKTFEAIMNRFGEPICIYNIPLTENELKRSNIEREITSRVATGNSEIFDLLDEYKQCGPEMDPLEKQFYLYNLAFYKEDMGEDPKTVLNLHVQALKLTMPFYKTGSLLENQLLTFDEIIILNNIARITYDLGKKVEAIRLLLGLTDYMEKEHIDREEKAKKYPMLLYNLSTWLGQNKQYREANDLCDRGIDCCVQYGKLTHFPLLIYNKGYSLAALGDIKAGKKYIRQALTIFEAMGETERAERIRTAVEKTFSIQF